MNVLMGFLYFFELAYNLQTNNRTATVTCVNIKPCVNFKMCNEWNNIKLTSNKIMEIIKKICMCTE